MPMEKTCFKCKRLLPITEFYVHPRMGDGRLNKCKTCAKADVRRNYEANLEHYRQYERGRASAPHRVAARAEYLKTEAGKLAEQKAKRKYAEKYPHKRTARHAVNNAVRGGRLTKKPCEVCGSTTRIHGHHDDYSKPLEVSWLCPKHHSERHKAMRRAA